MTMSAHRLGRRVGVLAAVATLLAGAAVTPSAAQAGPGQPEDGIATVGECRTYTFDQAMRASENSAPVDCSTSHTAKVLGTPMLPDGMTYGDIAALERVMLRTCYPAFGRLLGRTDSLRHRSAYTMMWFIPTQAQRDRGARWLRCDLVLQGGRTLQPIPADTAPILGPAPLRNRVARCATAQEVRTTCSRAHEWRATGTYLVPRDAYPGNRTMSRIAHRTCPSRTSTRAWYAVWATRAQWRAGDKMIVCHSRRSN